MLKMIYTRGLKYICLSACSYHGTFTWLNKANKWQSERDILSFLPMLITFWNVLNTFSSSYVKRCYVARSILELLVSQVHMFKFSEFTSWRWMMWQKFHTGWQSSRKISIHLKNVTLIFKNFVHYLSFTYIDWSEILMTTSDRFLW